RAQRLEQRSVRGASSQSAHVYPTRTRADPSSHFMAFGTAPIDIKILLSSNEVLYPCLVLYSG
ncbi:hypothetical protein, partial [Paenibacillus pseudetheri]|uniref:hypothetical protein n=1 Tax=Paenibacillus pseudetheri TaxID=2897682 RepID=UPI001F1FB429